MVCFSKNYIDSTIDYQECYRYEIRPFGIHEFLSRLYLWGYGFDGEHNLSNHMNELKYALVGYRLEICADPYDSPVAIAVSTTQEELIILTDLVGLTPTKLINKV